MFDISTGILMSLFLITELALGTMLKNTLKLVNMEEREEKLTKLPLRETLLFIHIRILQVLQYIF
jgi:hypothetical protein